MPLSLLARDCDSRNLYFTFVRLPAARQPSLSYNCVGIIAMNIEHNRAASARRWRRRAKFAKLHTQGSTTTDSIALAGVFAQWRAITKSFEPGALRSIRVNGSIFKRWSP